MNLTEVVHSEAANIYGCYFLQPAFHKITLKIIVDVTGLIKFVASAMAIVSTIKVVPMGVDGDGFATLCIF